MRHDVRVYLLVVWLASFATCLLIPLLAAGDIPNMYKQLMGQAADTYGPHLTAMLACLFPKRGKPLAWNNEFHAPDAIALLIGLGYCALFVSIFARFAMDRLTATDAVDALQAVRPLVSFLVAGILAYYFVSKRER